MRLLGFERVQLAPGESHRVTIAVDPRLHGRYDGADGFSGQWRIDEGTYRVAVGRSALDLDVEAEVVLQERTFRIVTHR